MFLERISNLKDFLLENKKAVLITLILFLGMIVSVYLVKEQKIFKSRAEAAPKEIKITPNQPANGDTITTDTPKLHILINKSDFEK